MGNQRKSPVVTESQFYMWRTLFALAHADNVVTNEEVRFMAEALEDVSFSEAQKAALKEDIKTPQDIAEMFRGVSDAQDQAKFFKFAHDLVWADGDYGKAEQDIMLRLQKAHIRAVNVDDLIGKVSMELEEPPRSGAKPPARRTAKKIVFSFRDMFLRDRL